MAQKSVTKILWTPLEAFEWIEIRQCGYCPHFKQTLLLLWVGRRLVVCQCGPLFWQPRIGHEKCIFETLYNEIKCVLNVKESNFNEKKINVFTLVYGQGWGGCWIPPSTISLTWPWNIRFFTSGLLNLVRDWTSSLLHQHLTLGLRPLLYRVLKSSDGIIDGDVPKECDDP